MYVCFQYLRKFSKYSRILSIYIYTRMHIYIYTCIYTYMFTKLCIYTYIYTYVHAHVSIHICIYLCIHVYIHTYRERCRETRGNIVTPRGRRRRGARARSPGPGPRQPSAELIAVVRIFSAAGPRATGHGPDLGRGPGPSKDILSKIILRTPIEPEVDAARHGLS